MWTLLENYQAARSRFYSAVRILSDSIFEVSALNETAQIIQIHHYNW